MYVKKFINLISISKLFTSLMNEVIRSAKQQKLNGHWSTSKTFYLCARMSLELCLLSLKAPSTT